MEITLKNIKSLVVVGTKLTYCDCCNNRQFTVTKVTGDLAMLIDEDGEIDSVDLDRMQAGWSFSKI